MRYRLLITGAGTLLFAARLAAAAEPLDLFDKEADAVRQCGRDTVVWLDVPMRSFWLQGQTGYGRSKDGGYTCRRDALKTGNRPSVR